jgi:hypothetical protein
LLLLFLSFFLKRTQPKKKERKKMTNAIEIKAQILNSNFTAQLEHSAKDVRTSILKTLDVKTFIQNANAVKATQSDVIDSLLIARFTLELIADVLLQMKAFNTFDASLKRVKRHANDFDVHYMRKNRKHIEIAFKS